MLSITREGGHTPFEFDTINRRRMRFPNRGDGVSVDPHDMPIGVLRNLLNDRHYKVAAETEEAQELIDKARKKPVPTIRNFNNFPMSQPRGEVRVRDDFTDQREREILEEQARRAAALSRTDPNAPPPGTGVDLAKNKDEPPADDKPQVDPNHPIFRLLEKAEAGMEWNELRRISKELLRDDFPGGSVGKEEVVTALRAKLAKGD